MSKLPRPAASGRCPATTGEEPYSLRQSGGGKESLREGRGRVARGRDRAGWGGANGRAGHSWAGEVGAGLGAGLRRGGLVPGRGCSRGSAGAAPPASPSRPPGHRRSPPRAGWEGFRVQQGGFRKAELQPHFLSLGLSWFWPCCTCVCSWLPGSLRQRHGRRAGRGLGGGGAGPRRRRLLLHLPADSGPAARRAPAAPLAVRR